MDSSPTKGEKMDTSDIDVDFIQDVFWDLTDRNKQYNFELKPSNYHLWGAENQILEKSPTLRNLVMTNSLEMIINYQQTFQDVLTELGLYYRLTKVPGNKPGLKGVMYDIQSTPRWSFGHFDGREDSAAEQAAKKGLSFFMEMAK